MYYRQAEIFVGYLHDTNPIAFEKMLLAIERGDSFALAFENAYGENLDVLWRRFLVKA